MARRSCITERCVFELTEKGLRLTEVYPGIDLKKDILDLLPFEVELGPGIAGPAREGRKE